MKKHDLKELKTLIELVNSFREDMFLIFNGKITNNQYQIKVKEHLHSTDYIDILVDKTKYDMLYNLIKKNIITLEIHCKKCGSQHFIYVDLFKYAKWKEGEGLIQDMLPDLTPSQRELILSGLCNDCFNEMFSETKHIV